MNASLPYAKEPLSVEGVLDAERRRGAALVDGDLHALRQLLAPELTHTHTRGVTDNLASFLHLVEHDVQFLDITRGEVDVRIVGTIAVMTGTSANLVQPRDKERILSRSQVLQVWEWREGRWVLVAFQSTNLPTVHPDPFSSYAR